MRTIFCIFTFMFVVGVVAHEQKHTSWTVSLADNVQSVTPPQPPLTWSRGETETNKIDILIVFDASVHPWFTENNRTPHEYAHTAISELNRVLSFTNIDRHFTFRLAGTLDLSPIDFGELSLGQIVSSFGGAPIPYLSRDTASRVRVARDETKADIVAFLTHIKKPRGRKPVYGSSNSLTAEMFSQEGITTYAEKAYCAVEIESQEQRHTLAHEIGHIFGAGHSNMQKNAPGPQLFTYSSAYRFHNEEAPLTTLLGYPERKDGEILPIFSSPIHVLTYVNESGETSRGLPLGTPTNDNTRTVLATSPLISQFRVSKPTPTARKFEAGFRVAIMSSNGTEFLVGGNPIVSRCGVNREFSVCVTNYSVASTSYQFHISHLPPGLTYNSVTQTISGVPTEAGDYSVLFRAKSNDGSNLQVRRYFTFQISPLPSWATGNYRNETGDQTITISSKGMIMRIKQKKFRVERSTQNGFVREEIDGAGNPTFILDDNSRLERFMANGTQCTRVKSVDGTIYVPVASNDRNRYSKSWRNRIKNAKRKEKNK